jgi:flavin reductase (DIM6/NTAB) family NADH-FMN oxidoreductase RutF
MKRSLGAKSLVYPTPVFVIGSYGEKGEPNVMTAAWAGICCSKPPAITVSLRKATYTHGNIVKRKAFTVNVPSDDMVVQADYFGMVSGRTEDKFAAVGYTPVRSDIVDAPYIEECAMVLECKLIQTHEIGLHTQFIGEIVDVKVEEDALDKDGICLMSKIRPFLYDPDDHNYYSVGNMLARGFDSGKAIERKKRKV